MQYFSKVVRLSLLVFFITGTICFAEGFDTTPQIISTTGSGEIQEDNTSDAKDKALSNGLIAAVESVLLKTLPQEVVVNNYKTITDLLYKKTSYFIDDYKVLAETRHENDYRVMVRATVSTKKILSALNDSGIVLDRNNRHKVLFLVSENNLQDLEPQFWWGQGMAYIKTTSDTAISQAMQKKGFKVLSHRLVNKGLIYNDQVGEPFTETLSEEEIISLGQYFNADIVVAGNAKAAQAPNTMGEDRTFTGEIVLHAWRCDSGEKIGSVSSKAIAVNTDETAGGNDALIEASISVTDSLASKINIAMKKDVEKSTMIEVIVEGTDFLKNYSKLIRSIRGLEETKKVTQREKRPGRAIVVVEFMGNGKTFAQKIMTQTFDGFGLSISEVTRNHARLEMIPPNSGLFQ